MSAMATPVALPVPGSKSVTHRAFILGALSSLPCRVEGPLMGADCRSTLAVLEALGARFTIEENAVQFTPVPGLRPTGACRWRISPSSVTTASRGPLSSEGRARRHGSRWDAPAPGAGAPPRRARPCSNSLPASRIEPVP